MKINLTMQVKNKSDDHSKTLKIKKSNEERRGKRNIRAMKTFFFSFFFFK